MLKTVFRYPGGKTKLVKSILPEMERILDGKNSDFTFIDVFVGGGSVSVGVANEYPNASIIINDLDEWMNCFWREVCTGETRKLVSRIMKHNPPTVQHFKHWREVAKSDVKMSNADKAFLALFFNRTTFSGIFRSGPIGGFSQEGKYKIHCRYNAERMIEIIENTAKDFRRRGVKCYKKDFAKIIKEYGSREDVFLYLDPPYMKQGSALYNHHMQKSQYQEMAELLKNCKAGWLVSHDDNPEFVKMYRDWATIKTIEGVAYTINSIKDKKMTELLISTRSCADTIDDASVMQAYLARKRAGA